MMLPFTETTGDWRHVRGSIAGVGVWAAKDNAEVSRRKQRSMGM
jgi:hypothetical protein